MNVQSEGCTDFLLILRFFVKKYWTDLLWNAEFSALNQAVIKQCPLRRELSNESPHAPWPQGWDSLPGAQPLWPKKHCRNIVFKKLLENPIECWTLTLRDTLKKNCKNCLKKFNTICLFSKYGLNYSELQKVWQEFIYKLNLPACQSQTIWSLPSDTTAEIFFIEFSNLPSVCDYFSSTNLNILVLVKKILKYK